MTYDLDAALNRIDPDPWNFEIKTNGTTYQTRELQIADLDALANLGSRSREEQDDYFCSLFKGSYPENLNDSGRAAACAAIVGYLQGRVAKKSRAIVAEVAAIASR